MYDIAKDKSWWARFMEIYAIECAEFPLEVILEAFYVYMGCSNQFAVTEVWRNNLSKKIDSI